MNTIEQTTAHLLMIEPVAFDFNAQTAVNNAFQQKGTDTAVQEKAAAEFNALAAALTAAGVDVTVIKDTPVPHTPDSIFPNNWISFHWDGTLVLYPMYAENRRAERKAHVISAIAARFDISNQLDFSSEESNQRFLEGTGSMVLDRQHKIAYACLSPRTHATVLQQWCNQMGYRSCMFHSLDEKGGEVYHTNVMMCVADRYAVVCLESVRDSNEQQQLVQLLEQTGKTIVPITLHQMNHFAGNMLQVKNKDGKQLLVMSSQAYHSLTAAQLATLESFNPVLHADLTTIETNGGGSARCMLAEIFLPLKKRN